MESRVEEVLRLMHSHRSIRKYKLGENVGEDLKAILKAVNRSPTSWNLMPVTIIVVRDREIKRRLSNILGGQEHIWEAPVFLVFAVDFAKVEEASTILGYTPAKRGLGHLVSGVVNAGIMAGWAALAAEALGYGITLIAVYTDACGVAEILGLPDGVIPVVGMTVGIPAESPSIRPRQPLEAMISFDGYGESPRVKADGVVSVYGGRARRLFERVVAEEGYFQRLNERMRRCLESRGYLA